MPGTAPDFRLRAVITEIEGGYIVSISKVSHGDEITILCEEEVVDIKASDELISKVTGEQLYPAKNVDKLYNVGGKLTSKPPKGRK